jgi:hypothetical protein
MTHSLYHSSVAPFPAMSRPSLAERGAEAQHVPNFAARRIAAVAVLLSTVAFVVTVFVLLAGLGGRPASASQAEPANSTTSAVHVASAGDTLWSIAEDNHGEMGLDRYVDTLIDLNGGTDVQIGQAIRLP